MTTTHDGKNCGPAAGGGMDRRRFLGTTITAGAAVGATTALGRATAAAKLFAVAPPTLICVYLRGGMDGLSLVAPVNDGYYQQKRSHPVRVSVPATPGDRRWLVTNGIWDFALPTAAVNPANVDLKVPYLAGDLTFVHGVGLGANSRSHFEAMKTMEFGIDPLALVPGTGWIARMMQNIPVPDPVRGFSHGKILPRSMLGAPKTQAILDVSNYTFPGDPVTAYLRRIAIEYCYLVAAAPYLGVQAPAADAFASLDTLGGLTYPPPGPNYPASPFGKALADTATILKTPGINLQSVHIDIGGWDHHAVQGTEDPNGVYYAMIGNLSRALGAFYLDMGAANVGRYLVIVMSEFGRRIEQNSSLGTDHGTGNAMILMGAGVAAGGFGGNVFHEFTANGQGLADPANRYPAAGPGAGEDLITTIDIRDVLYEAAIRRFGYTGTANNLFPSTTWTPRATPPNIIG